MRILCFTDSLVSGGAQRQLVNISILLKNRSHEVHFVVYRNIPFFEHYLSEHNIILHIINSKNYLDRIIKARKMFYSISPDIIISFLETPNFIAAVSSITHHKWKLITNELSAKESSFHGLRSKLFKWFERFSDTIVCNSNNARNMWKRYYPQYSSKLKTIYNPIIVPDNLIQKSSLNKKTILVIPASYQYLKNPINVIKAVYTLSEDEKNRIEIHWYGRKEPSKGETQAYLEAVDLVKRYSLSNIVFLHEETKNIYDIISKADVVGLFSTVEGLPNAICEGMMLGKPVIMSRVSDYKLFITPKNGIQCNPRDVDSISQALKEFLNIDSSKRKEMGLYSREIANHLFDKDLIARKWEDLMSSLLSDLR